MRMTATLVLSSGKPAETAKSANPTGNRGKKTAATKVSFADFVAGMASGTIDPGKIPAGDSRPSPDSLKVKRQGLPGQASSRQREVKENPGPGLAESEDNRKLAKSGDHQPEQLVQSALSKAQEIIRPSSRSTASRVHREPATTVRGHSITEAQKHSAGSFKPTEDHGSLQADAGRTENRTEGRDGAEKPFPVSGRLSQEVRAAAADTGVVNPTSGGEALRTAADGAPGIQAAAPERTGLSLSPTQMDVLMDRMVQSIKSAPTSLEVRLQPEVLGKVNILVESQGGAITISIVAQNADTATLLSNNLASMRTYLEQLGINLQQMEVNQGYRENHGQPGDHPKRGPQSEVCSQTAPGEEAISSGDLLGRNRWNRPSLNILA